jgi:hypothetical protein
VRGTESIGTILFPLEAVITPEESLEYKAMLLADLDPEKDTL